MRIAGQTFRGFLFGGWSVDPQNSEINSTVKISTYTVIVLSDLASGLRIWSIKRKLSPSISFSSTTKI